MLLPRCDRSPDRSVVLARLGGGRPGFRPQDHEADAADDAPDSGGHSTPTAAQFCDLVYLFSLFFKCIVVERGHGSAGRGLQAKLYQRSKDSGGLLISDEAHAHTCDVHVHGIHGVRMGICV